MQGQGPNNFSHPGHNMQHHNQGGQYQGQQSNMGGPGQGFRKPQTPANVDRGGRYPPRGNPGGFGNAPAKSQNALVSRGPINLITNNFKIKSSSNGIIYTYAVDFIDGEAIDLVRSNPETPTQEAVAAMAKLALEETKEPAHGHRHKPVVRDLAVDNLETFQKYKILGA